MADDDIDVPGAWREFCARLGGVGDRLAREPFPQSGADQALCTCHVARQLVMALQAEIEHADVISPTFHRYEEPWVQWGGPNPDNVYTRAAIDPTATYRVTGNVHGVRAALFSLVDGDMHLGRYGVFSECTLADLDVAADGAVEFWISPEPRTGNWIESHPDARLSARPAIPLRLGTRPCRDLHHRARRRDAASRRTPPTAFDMSSALERAATWVEQLDRLLVHLRGTGPRDAAAHNAVAPPSTPRGGAPTIAYGAGWWDLGPDEVLLITTDVPDADYWGWTVHHRYRLDSGDFANRQTSLNLAQAFVDDDGRIRLVVAHDDPGVPNWIDTERQPEGMLVYRSIGTRSRPVPDVRVVALAALREHLPASHPVVDRGRAARAAGAAAGRACSPATSDHGVVAEAAPAVGRPSSTRSVVNSGRRPRSSRSTEDSLLDTARTSTGLDDFGDDDFGADGWRTGSNVFVTALETRGRPPSARPDHGPQRDRPRAREPARDAGRRSAPIPRSATERIEAAAARRRDRAFGYVDPARAARAGSRAIASRARGSCCTRARRPSAPRTRPIRASPPPIRSTGSGIWSRPSTGRCTRTAATSRTKIR